MGLPSTPLQCYIMVASQHAMLCWPCLLHLVQGHPVPWSLGLVLLYLGLEPELAVWAMAQPWAQGHSWYWWLVGGSLLSHQPAYGPEAQAQPLASQPAQAPGLGTTVPGVLGLQGFWPWGPHYPWTAVGTAVITSLGSLYLGTGSQAGAAVYLARYTAGPWLAGPAMGLSLCYWVLGLTGHGTGCLTGHGWARPGLP